jgi:hypothetical protein
MHERALRLIDRIYAAAVDPDVWQEVTEGVSEIFDGSPRMLSFVIPGEDGGTRYAVGIDEPYRTPTSSTCSRTRRGRPGT